VDLCARGANAADRLLVGILRVPDNAEMSGGKCMVSSFSSVPRLRVVEARHDSLLLEPLPRVGATPANDREEGESEIDVETALACYGEFVDFDLRLDDQYVVGTSQFGYQHRNMSAADGTCTRDESLDPRLTSRARIDEEFVNQFVAFTLTSDNVTIDAGSADAGEEEPADEGGEEAGAADDLEAGAADDLDAGDAVDSGAAAEAGEEPDAGAEAPSPELPVLDDKEVARRREVNPNITLAKSTTPIYQFVAEANTGRSDTLPHRVRYFPDNNYLFVVDQASQGLRRYFLVPKFEPDEDSSFR
jgi:hypothetical protein